MRFIKFMKLNFLCKYIIVLYRMQIKAYDNIISLAKELNVKLVNVKTRKYINLNDKEKDEWWNK